MYSNHRPFSFNPTDVYLPPDDVSAFSHSEETKRP
jgi:hypothetical protein